MNIVKIRLGNDYLTNCYIVISEKGNAAVIDPGDDYRYICQILEKNNADLKYIFLTHGHFDHTGASGHLRGSTGAKLCMGRADYSRIENHGKFFARSLYEIPDGDFAVDMFAEDGQEIELDELKFRIMETPGHSEGGVAIIIDDVIFCGDTLFRESYGRTDTLGGDLEILRKSIERIMNLEGDYHLKCGHGEDSTLEYERNHNPIFAG